MNNNQMIQQINRYCLDIIGKESTVNQFNKEDYPLLAHLIHEFIAKEDKNTLLLSDCWEEEINKRRGLD